MSLANDTYIFYDHILYVYMVVKNIFYDTYTFYDHIYIIYIFFLWPWRYQLQLISFSQSASEPVIRWPPEPHQNERSRWFPTKWIRPLHRLLLQRSGLWGRDYNGRYMLPIQSWPHLLPLLFQRAAAEARPNRNGFGLAADNTVGVNGQPVYFLPKPLSHLFGRSIPHRAFKDPLEEDHFALCLAFQMLNISANTN